MRRAADLIRRLRLMGRRQSPAGDTQQTLVLLPWLNLNGRVSVGPMLLDRLTRGLTVDGHTFLEALMGTPPLTTRDRKGSIFPT